MAKASNRRRRSNCPVSCVLDIVGDKWTLLVVRDLVLGKHHFEQFLHSPEKIATNILSSRLKMLEEAGYVEKRTDPDDRRKSIYGLTQRGQELRPLIRCIAKWGTEHLPGTKPFRKGRGTSR